MEEEKLPVISNSSGVKSKILMKSPWEILQKSIGSAGVISQFSSLNLLDDLSQMGVEYVEVSHFMSNFCCSGPFSSSIMLAHLFDLTKCSY